MDSRKLSARIKQPGHDRTFRTSEENFVAALLTILPPEEWRVQDHPKELSKILAGKYGIVPEACITYLPTGRKVYFEVKKQGPAGNADERACKHHTVQFYVTMKEHTGYEYHPFVTILCESLATDPRYTTKHPYFFEDGQYFCWTDYDLESLADFIDGLRMRWLED